MNKIKNCIFIIGCGHSGTTIFNKIISNHKNIYGINYETGLFIHNKDKQIIYKKLETLDNERKFINKKWLCEKTPGHIYHIDDMLQFVENPKIIIVIRDGRDVVASLNKRYNDLEMSMNRWIDDNLAWFTHYLKDYFYILKYEKLIRDPSAELRGVCEYIKESYDENMLNYSKEHIELPTNIFNDKIDGKKHELLRLYQINQPLYDGSNRYLKDLSKKDMDFLLLNDKFIFLMKQFEYL